MAGRIQKDAIVGMMLHQDEEGKTDTSASALRFDNLDKVVPVLE